MLNDKHPRTRSTNWRHVELNSKHFTPSIIMDKVTHDSPKLLNIFLYVIRSLNIKQNI